LSNASGSALDDSPQKKLELLERNAKNTFILPSNQTTAEPFTVKRLKLVTGTMVEFHPLQPLH
jgi:hypothetical protein